jgi:hypothetical protein
MSTERPSLFRKLDVAITNAVRNYQNRDMWPIVKPPKRTILQRLSAWVQRGKQ